MVASGGIAATVAAWQDTDLLVSLLVATLVVLLAMRTTQARARLAPVLLVLAGLVVTVFAATTPFRTWF